MGVAQSAGEVVWCGSNALNEVYTVETCFHFKNSAVAVIGSDLV